MPRPLFGSKGAIVPTRSASRLQGALGLPLGVEGVGMPDVAPCFVTASTTPWPKASPPRFRPICSQATPVPPARTWPPLWARSLRCLQPQPPALRFRLPLPRQLRDYGPGWTTRPDRSMIAFTTPAPSGRTGHSITILTRHDTSASGPGGRTTASSGGAAAVRSTPRMAATFHAGGAKRSCPHLDCCRFAAHQEVRTARSRPVSEPPLTASTAIAAPSD